MTLDPGWAVVAAAFIALLGVAVGYRVSVATSNRQLENAKEIARLDRDAAEQTARLDREKAELTARLDREKTEQIATLERQNALRLAAVDKRLETAQKAYSLWWDLFTDFHGPNLHEKLYDYQQWWKANCLYLEARSREAFNDGLVDASLFQSQRGDEKKAIFKRLRDVFGILAEGVGLPSLGDQEVPKPTSPQGQA